LQSLTAYLIRSFATGALVWIHYHYHLHPRFQSTMLLALIGKLILLAGYSLYS
jgi:hypothetical protein